VTSLMAPLSVA